MFTFVHKRSLFVVKAITIKIAKTSGKRVKAWDKVKVD